MSWSKNGLKSRPERSRHLDRLGVHFFIVKPFNFDDLREIVRFLKDWLLDMTPPPTDEKDWIPQTCRDLEKRWPQWHRRAA